MKKYKLKGITEYAKDRLSDDDIEDLLNMVGTEVYESEESSMVDDRMMIDMPDGMATHSDFLELEEIGLKLNI